MPANNLPLLAEFLDEDDFIAGKFYAIEESLLAGGDLIPDCEVEGLFESPEDNYLLQTDTMDVLVYSGGIDELLEICEVESNGV